MKLNIKANILTTNNIISPYSYIYFKIYWKKNINKIKIKEKKNQKKSKKKYKKSKKFLNKKKQKT